MNTEQLNILKIEVYQNARDHGWWDKPRVLGEMLALLHSEVSEAFECLCENKLATEISESGKPEGFLTEIADVVIRCLDMAGGADGFSGSSNIRLELLPCVYEPMAASEWLLTIHKEISDLLERIRDNDFDSVVYGKHLSKIIDSCFALAYTMSLFYTSIGTLTLTEVIMLKHEYNKTRPYRHGNKVL